ncbi:TPA: hypothetical protein N0F65_011403 [Lagenidium giganteum]|uniref:Cyclic nucleotide-binding domain-containing protein n=1 Tax=Lagenidium giganteum TaxID=4803 RepID=A0AAV2Z9R6_9STRA|nr:TPA: hypothetical protein N0F65_011403 [Lagenidium giganteum]
MAARSHFEVKLTTTSTAAATPPEPMAAAEFAGNDDWIRAQLHKQALKTEKKELRGSIATVSVPFDRQEFSERVQRILEDDVNDGFVIGLKRRREFAIQLCEDYKQYTEEQKLELVLALAIDLGLQDLSLMVKTLPSLPRTHLVLNVIAAALGFSRKNDPTISKSIKRGLVPATEQFFVLVGSVPQGPKFVLHLRSDLTDLIKKYRPQLSKDNVEALEYLDMVMRDLFATQAGMRFRRVDMSSEKTLAYMLKHERVHAIRNWADLRRRIVGPNRFCFGLFHLQLPTAPLVFVQVVASDHLCEKIDPILENDGPVIQDPSHIVFYSISNANNGLRGLNIASHLLFLTIERMTQMFPRSQVAATLSPVPGFAAWLHDAICHQHYVFFSTEQSQTLSVKFGVNQHQLGKWLIKRLKSNDWLGDAEFVAATKDVLLAACARYVLFARRGDKMHDAVANFHLQNGAQVEQINFLGDPSPRGLRNSFGIMINYRYCMNSIDTTSVSYKRHSSAAASPTAARWVWTSHSLLLDEIEALKSKRNIPLFARVYRPGEVLCARGSLPTAIYFISAGRVRVAAAHSFSLEAGDCYGEHETFSGEPMPYTLTAESLTHVIILRSEDALFVLEQSESVRDFAATGCRGSFLKPRRIQGHQGVATSRL